MTTITQWVFSVKRFTAKQIHAPQTVFGMSEKRQPGRAAPPRRWAVVLGEDAAHDVLVDRYAECKRKLLCNPATAESRISSFHLDDCVDQLS